MNHRILFLLLGLAGALLTPVARAQEAKTCFVQMPDSLSPLLSAVNRADFIDFLESKMKAEVTNTLGGKSEMTELTSDYLSIKLTPQSTWQMKLLTAADSTQLICVVATACAPACDSHIRFYTTGWTELPASRYLPSLPQAGDFLAEVPDTVYSLRDARRLADILLLKADLSAQSPTLTFTFATPDYMEKEAAEKLKPFLRRPVTYTWKEGVFVPDVTFP